MKGIRAVSCVVAMAMLAVPALASDYCATESPESVFSCFQNLVTATAPNETELEKLFARDFQFLHRPDKNGRAPDPSGRDRFIEGIVWTLSASTIRNPSMQLVMGSPGQAGAEPDTWIFENATSVLEFDGLPDGATEWNHVRVVKDTVTLEVRREDTPTPHYVIYRWTESQE